MVTESSLKIVIFLVARIYDTNVEEILTCGVNCKEPELEELATVTKIVVSSLYLFCVAKL